MRKSILLVDIDSTIPNLALKKLELYYRQHDYDVFWNSPLERFLAEKVFVSSIFTWNREKCKEWEGIAEIGGTGYDIKKTLPPEIDSILPKINYYCPN